jgi:hypothetical protein
MIDTIVLASNNFDLGSIDLNNVEDLKTAETNGNICYSGKLDRFNLNFWPGHISARGSLSKYYLGNNVETMSRKDVEKAVEQMSNNLGLDVGNFDVWRVDVGATFRMNHPVSNYLAYLESCPRYTTATYPESRMFRNRQKTLIFYDKGIEFLKKESKEVKRQLQSRGFRETDNHFRYELQIQKKTKMNLGLREFKAKHLYDEKVYTKLIELWKKEFDKVKKKREIMDFQTEGLIKPKQIKESLACVGLEKLGKQEILEMIKRKYYEGEIKKPDYYRMKSMFEQMENRFGTKSEYIQELEQEVNNRARYCR